MFITGNYPSLFKFWKQVPIQYQNKWLEMAFYESLTAVSKEPLGILEDNSNLL